MLTLRDIQNITGWTWITATNFAKDAGAVRADGDGRGTWLIRSSAIDRLLKKEQDALDAKRNRFYAIMMDG